MAGQFQVSAPRGNVDANGKARPSVAPGQVVQVGLRDKLGYADGPKSPTPVQGRVVAPDGTSTVALGNLVDTNWLYLNYPNDFNGAPKVYPAGIYTVIWTHASNGGFLACDGFWAG